MYCRCREGDPREPRGPAEVRSSELRKLRWKEAIIPERIDKEKDLQKSVCFDHGE